MLASGANESVAYLVFPDLLFAWFTKPRNGRKHKNSRIRSKSNVIDSRNIKTYPQSPLASQVGILYNVPVRVG